MKRELTVIQEMSAKIALGIGVCLALLAPSPTFANEWKIDDTISALDGSRTYVAMLGSTNTIRDAAGGDEEATLVIRCSSGSLQTYIAWPRSLGQGPLEMRWKADAGSFTTEVWSVSADGGATFSEGARAFLGKLRGAHRAFFQLSLANFDFLQASFVLAGIDKIVNSALAICAR